MGMQHTLYPHIHTHTHTNIYIYIYIYMRIAYKGIVKTSPHGRSRRRCENIIKKDVKETVRNSTGFFWLRIRVGGGLL